MFKKINYIKIDFICYLSSKELVVPTIKKLFFPYLSLFSLVDFISNAQFLPHLLLPTLYVCVTKLIIFHGADWELIVNAFASAYKHC